MPGKFFIAVSRMNGLVLHVKRANPGAEVIMCHRKDPSNKINQQWYEDASTGTVRTRLNDFCLDVSGNGDLVVNPYNSSNNQQKWDVKPKKAVIQNRHNQNMVVYIKGENNQLGASLCARQFKSNPNQMWNIDFLEPNYFTIISEMHDKVLEVQGGNSAPGTRVCMNRPNGSVHQQWFESKFGITSRLNKLPLTTAGVLCDGATLMVKPHPWENKPDNHFFVLSGNKIVNKADANHVCDVAGCNGCDGADVIIRRYEGKPNQHWRYKEC